MEELKARINELEEQKTYDTELYITKLLAKDDEIIKLEAKMVELLKGSQSNKRDLDHVTMYQNQINDQNIKIVCDSQENLTSKQDNKQKSKDGINEEKKRKP